jgi:hypothetical protein
VQEDACFGDVEGACRAGAMLKMGVEKCLLQIHQELLVLPCLDSIRIFRNLPRQYI